MSLGVYGDRKVRCSGFLGWKIYLWLTFCWQHSSVHPSYWLKFGDLVEFCSSDVVFCLSAWRKWSLLTRSSLCFYPSFSLNPKTVYRQNIFNITYYCTWLGRILNSNGAADIVTSRFPPLNQSINQSINKPTNRVSSKQLTYFFRFSENGVFVIFLCYQNFFTFYISEYFSLKICRSFSSGDLQSFAIVPPYAAWLSLAEMNAPPGPLLWRRLYGIIVIIDKTSS